jgi:hypothetical protein
MASHLPASFAISGSKVLHPFRVIDPESMPAFTNVYEALCARAMVNPFKFLSNRVLKTSFNSEGLTSHKQGGFMNQDLITPRDRLLFSSSKHDRSDKIFKLGLLLGAAYFLGHIAYAALVGAI